MVFKCQEDSFLKEFESKVVLCERAQLTRKNGDNQGDSINGYNVVLEDTILFPEGGGQPCDYGYLNQKPVIDVRRKGKDAFHFVPSDENVPPFSVGENVCGVIDWTRRHDHMQQHSGQHLITAIFEREYNIETISWSLSPEVSYVEVNSKDTLTQTQIEDVEKICNELIAAATPVLVHLHDGHFDGDTPPEVTRATKGLPKDHVGDIRIITIQGVESNMCCGTHVTNLAQLQCIKLLNVEKSKNRQFLNFLVGNRVLKRLHNSFERECELNGILNGGSQSHIELIKKIQMNQKSSQRLLVSCLKELAQNEAAKLKALNPVPKWYSVHRKDGIDMDFINTFLRNAPEIKNGSTTLSLLFLTAGEDNGNKGNMVLFGDEGIVEELGPKLCDILEGKGRGKGQRFQAKVNNLKRLAECKTIICEYFQNKA